MSTVKWRKAALRPGRWNRRTEAIVREKRAITLAISDAMHVWRDMDIALRYALYVSMGGKLKICTRTGCDRCSRTM